MKAQNTGTKILQSLYRIFKLFFEFSATRFGLAHHGPMQVSAEITQYIGELFLSLSFLFLSIVKIWGGKKKQ